VDGGVEIVMRSGFSALAILMCVSLALSGCGGGSPPASASSITLTPSTMDLTVGNVATLSASVLDSKGKALSPQPTITYDTSDASALTISSTGSVCAGVWDVAYVVCRPGRVPSGPVTLRATADGITSSISVTVHLQIDQITISAPAVNCVSQNNTLQFTAKAFNKGVDVTSSVGSFTWQVSDGTVAQVNSSGLAISRTPGITNVFVSAANTTSSPLAFVSCPIKRIQLAQVGTGVTSFAMNKGDTVTVQATAYDVLGNVVNGPTLNFSSSQAAVARATTTGVIQATISGLTAGAFTVVASCTPSQCNNAPAGTFTTSSGQATAKSLGFGYPIYSNLVRGTVAGSSTTVTSVYVTGDSYPDGHTNHQVRVYDSSTLTQQTTITLPFVPNSMVFSRQGDKAYIGSDDGTGGDSMMVLDPGANTAAAFSGTVTGDVNITTVTGKVLAVSPDGAKVVVANASRVFIVNVSGSSAQVFFLPGIRSASFSPDSFKAFLAGEGGVYEYTTNLNKVTSTGASTTSSVAYLFEGPAAYISGTALAAYATCNDQPIDQSNTAVGAMAPVFSTGNPILIGASGPNWVHVGVTPGTDSCPSSISSSVTTANAGSCTIQRITPLADGSKVFATAVDTQSCSAPGAISEYDVASGAVTSIPLTGGGTSIAGDASLDGKQLYLGVTSAGNGSVHFIDLSKGSDAVQIAVPFVPNIVAVQPK
jgi:hypothetical protein